MWKFKKKESVSNTLTHIAFIMDGNGRWAKSRNLPREAGHAAGSNNLRTILSACKDRGISIVTVYAFSTENWKRPKHEIDAIMKLLDKYLTEADKDKEKNQMHIRVIGDISVLEDSLKEKIEKIERDTSVYSKFTLNIALNYGGQQEIVHAVNSALASGLKTISLEDISNNLYTSPCPPPDLIIRTSGEMRTSNFLLWQSAYSEYAFTKTYWPAFSVKELDKILKDYASRHRRFGGV